MRHLALIILALSLATTVAQGGPILDSSAYGVAGDLELQESCDVLTGEFNLYQIDATNSYQVLGPGYQLLAEFQLN